MQGQPNPQETNLETNSLINQTVLGGRAAGGWPEPGPRVVRRVGRVLSSVRRASTPENTQRMINTSNTGREKGAVG